MGNRIKHEQTKKYYIVSSYHLNDKKLSLKAKGLLTFMLTRSNDWEFSIPGLAKALNESVYSIKELIKELKDNNYLVIEKSHKNGKYEYSYIIYEERQYQEVENQPIENMPIDLLFEYLKNKKGNKELKKKIWNYISRIAKTEWVKD